MSGPPNPAPEPPSPAEAAQLVGEVRARVAELVEVLPKQRSREDYRALRERLVSVAADDRGIPWLEAALLVDVVFRRRAKVARPRLERLSRLHREAGDDEAARELWRQVAAAAHPSTLGTHGYRRALAARDHGRLWREAREVADELTRRGFAAYAVSGTLLGIVRDGRLIGHDDDLDLAVLLTSRDPGSAAQEWDRVRQQWEAEGLLDPETPWDTYIHVKARTESGVAIDVFPSWLEGDRAFVWPHTHGTASAADLLPLRTETLAGQAIPVPARPEPFLESNYGPDWRSPDPSWRFNWAQARALFPAAWIDQVRRGGPGTYDEDEG